MSKQVIASCLVALAACEFDEPEDATATVAQDIEASNGISINGISINGISINGISINGISINGISLNGTSLTGTSLLGAVGSTWTGTLTNGASIALRIDSAEQGSGINADIGMYGISYETPEGWQPLCGTDGAGAPILALAVPGTWNLESGVAGGGAYTPSSTEMSLACRGKTIAKCVELGYKPWLGRTTQLASCVRLLRGDYCGNGTPYTQTGTLLNLYDGVGVQLDTQPWEPEAEWTPNGARCISKQRDTRFRMYGLLPKCITDGTLRSSPSCGLYPVVSFALGASLISELPPQ